jgi:hypothetical protein
VKTIHHDGEDYTKQKEEEVTKVVDEIKDEKLNAMVDDLEKQ